MRHNLLLAIRQLHNHMLWVHYPILGCKTVPSEVSVKEPRHLTNHISRAQSAIADVHKVKLKRHQRPPEGTTFTATCLDVRSRKSVSAELPSKRNKALPEDCPPAECLCGPCIHTMHSLPSSTDRSPSLLEFFVQLCRLQHADEHEDKSTPCTQNLDGPPTGSGWEDWKFLTCAVRTIPEPIPIHVTVPLGAIIPWRESFSNTIRTVLRPIRKHFWEMKRFARGATHVP